MQNQIEKWKQERKEGFKRFMIKYFKKEIKIERFLIILLIQLKQEIIIIIPIMNCAIY